MSSRRSSQDVHRCRAKSSRMLIETLSVRVDDIADALTSPDAEVRKRAEDIRDTRVEHRDGLLFQHVSWIAANMRLPNAKATPPHVRQADKGFDGVLLEVDPAHAGLSRIVLCEDKASIKPRALVTQSIWPEIKLIQANKKDREILAALTAILDTMPGVDREAVIDATEWHRARQFRVALTVGGDQIKDGGYQHIFAGFEGAAGGEIESAHCRGYDDERRSTLSGRFGRSGCRRFAKQALPCMTPSPTP